VTSARGALAVFSLLFAAACSEGSEDRISWLSGRAEEVRELDLLRGVAVSSISRDQFLANADADAQEIKDAELAELAETWGRLGFFDPSLDLRPVLGAKTSAWVAASYSSESERITLIGSPADTTVVHEFVHALQDQHFDLDAYEDQESADGVMARAAVVEGDAELAEYRFEMQERYGVDLDRLDWSKLLPALEQRSREFLDEAKYPVFFASYPAFVYTYGLTYCARELTGAAPAHPQPTRPFPFAWSREDALLSSAPPESTRAIMTFDAIPDEPLDVGLEAVPSALGDRLEAVDSDVLGAWLTYLLFHPLDGSAPFDGPVGLAGAWRGDRVLFVRDLDSGALGAVWTSMWVDEAASEKVEGALGALHEVTPDAVEPRLGTSASGDAVWIERSDAALVFVTNVDPELAAELAKAALPVQASAKSGTFAGPSAGRRISKLIAPRKRR
jgi:hypothetical protein